MFCLSNRLKRKDIKFNITENENNDRTLICWDGTSEFYVRYEQQSLVSNW